MVRGSVGDEEVEVAAERGAEDAGAKVADGDGAGTSEVDGLEVGGAPVAEAYSHGHGRRSRWVGDSVVPARRRRGGR